MRPLLLPLALSVGLTGCAVLTDTPMRQTADGSLKPVVTWKDATRRNVVMQDYDYSCGAAALATLLKYYFGDPVPETEILKNVLAHLDKETFAERRRDGLSMLDLKQYVERRGYEAAGVRLTPTALKQLRGPVLVYLQDDELHHFAILRGVRENRVYLADPAAGDVRMPVDRFVRKWPGYTLVLGKPGFGTPQDTDLAVNMLEPFRPELPAVRRAFYVRK
jgi:uncharacterized protein